MENAMNEILKVINYVLADVANDIKQEKVDLMYEDMIEELEMMLWNELERNQYSFDNDSYYDWK